ncbi:MAG: glycosyltransferase family 4 protein [Burkholderiaceae bacterium]
MRLALVSDAWLPQVNGVVTTLAELVTVLKQRGFEIHVIHPGLFKTRPCPGYPEIALAMGARAGVRRMLDEFAPDAVHIATEGPLGWAARSHCMKCRWAFTTAFHTRFPEILHAAVKIPLGAGYALFKHFHAPSSGVMVPSKSMLQLLEARGFKNLRAWTHGVDTQIFQERKRDRLWHLARPIQLFVGRVSYEKNIDAFLSMDLPGSKVVCGVGPVLGRLKQQYPDVHWLGVLPRDDLAQVYSSADVFVFPSKSDTFGLVMLEAMACGTPVAAYPVEGALEVVGNSAAGVMHEDLRVASERALQCSRDAARQRALSFSWDVAASSFAAYLVPCTSAASAAMLDIPHDQTAQLGH